MGEKKRQKKKSNQIEGRKTAKTRKKSHQQK